jgi:predicted DNA repair protein MutK
LTTTANDLAGEAKREFKAKQLPIEIVNKVVADQVAVMAKRAAEWKAGSSGDDLTKASSPVCGVTVHA